MRPAAPIAGIAVLIAFSATASAPATAPARPARLLVSVYYVGGCGSNGCISEYIQLFTPHRHGFRPLKSVRAVAPVFSPQGDRVADTEGEFLIVSRPDGHGRHRLGKTTGAASWSPDGRRLALGRDVTDPLTGKDTTFVFTIRRDGRDLRMLTDGDEPSWSPRGRTLAFTRDGWIWTIRLDGTGARRLVPGEFPQWSPRGNAIVYTRGRVIYRISPTGGHRHALARGYLPRFSPDGRNIAFGRGSDGVFEMRADGSGVRRVGNPNALVDYDLTADDDSVVWLSWQPLR